MKIKGVNPETGVEYESESERVNEEFMRDMSKFDLSNDSIKKFIDNLNISADAKALLYSFSKATIKVGERILKLGRKIIDFVVKIYQEYPSASFGLVFGAIVGFLVASIPIIGAVLGPIFFPISVALGLLKGVEEDLKDKGLLRKIAEINAKFEPLKA